MDSEFPEEALLAGKIPPMAYVRTSEQAEAARAAGLRVVCCPEDYRTEALQALKARWIPGDWLSLPSVCEEETLQALRIFAEEMKEVLGGVVLGSVGQLGIAWPVPVGAGPAVPVMNRQAASALFEEGCVFVTASPELTGQELKTLLKGAPAITVTVYGRTRLMLLHHCPARTALGLAKGHRDCRMCDEGHPDALKGQVLEDRKGYRFPLLRQRLPEGCLVELMNALPTDNIVNSQYKIENSQFTIHNSQLWNCDNNKELKVIIFTTENAEETNEVLRAFAEGRKTNMETTSGHWKRSVE